MSTTRTLAFVCVAALLYAADSGAADFNGDGMADILWREPAGDPLVWQMNGLNVDARHALTSEPDAGAVIAGTGNFFGTGADTILWINSAHELSLWQSNGATVTQTCTVANSINPSWDFLGIGDVNGDGVDDVLWRLPGGTIEVLLMDGCNAPQTVSLGASADPTWSLAGIGDVDGDGFSDLLWRDSNGNIVLWQLGASEAVTSTTLAAGTYASWNVAAVADFDGDGKADILWRDSSNDLALWFMDGTLHTEAAVSAAAGVLTAPDAIFISGYETNTAAAPVLTSRWTILGAADYTGDGDADILFADADGYTAIWQMQGAVAQASALIAPSGDMPYVQFTGWRLPQDRPTITKVGGQVTVAWNALAGNPPYTLYESPYNNPASNGIETAQSGTSLTFTRGTIGYADKRYFAVSAAFHGFVLPPSPEAYIVEFSPLNLPYWGALAIDDINGDGCLDLLGALGNCEGDFTLDSEANMGLSALRAPGRAYRDVRFADFNGDGILDAVANVYSCDASGCGGDHPSSQILLFLGNGDGTFSEDAAFTALNVPGGGFGETIVVADFNNDGYLDIFLPKYTAYDASEHNFLLLNDGTGHFTDVADTAGVALRNVPLNCRVEGAQAVDINGDGRIDLYTGSHLFLNQGNDASGIPLFADLGATIAAATAANHNNCNVIAASPAGLPVQFDEGAKFIDFDNSGQLTLALNTVYSYASSPATSAHGIRLFTFDGVGHFTEKYAMPQGLAMNESFGLNAADVDGDGRSDLIVAGGCDPSHTYGDPNCYLSGDPHALPQLLLNRGNQFVIADFYNDGLTPTTRGWGDLQATADFDASGTVDIVSRFADGNSEGGAASGYLTVLMNLARSYDTIRVDVVGANGEHNQAGRVVHVTPDARSSVTMTQVVDGGSGYMANSPYELTFATPYPGTYTVSVRFASATFTARARAGDHVTLYANGTVTVQR
jgi:hypothetical protein